MDQVAVRARSISASVLILIVGWVPALLVAERAAAAQPAEPPPRRAEQPPPLRLQWEDRRAVGALLQRRVGQPGVQIELGGRIRVRGAQTSIPVEDDLAATTFRPDREALRLLRKARELTEQQRYSDTVQALGRILEAEEDSFFPTSEDGLIHRSVKAEAERMIGRLPKSGRDSYQLQYGAAARQMLDEAVRDGDVIKLGEVSRRFFHTHAGYEATHLLGIHHFDSGRPLAAALCFRRLADTGSAARRFEPMMSVRMAACWSRAGMRDAARQTLEALDRQYPRATVMIAGEKQKLPTAGDDALVWLARTVGKQSDIHPPSAELWTMFRGSPSRNARSKGGRPLLAHRWRIPTVNSGPLIEKVAGQLHRAYVDQNVGALPGFHPLAVQNVVLMRTSANLLAVDFLTGKRIWEVPVGDSVAEFMPGAESAATGLSQQLVQQLDRRLWEDATYGTLSSDGHYVFSVEDLDIPFRAVGGRAMVMVNGRQMLANQTMHAYNRLAAHDVRSGKLKWEIGGPPGEYELEQAGAFFLGPPLPLVGHLYVLAEVKGEIRLLVLDAKTGDVKWTQQLAILEQNINRDAFRRWAGVSPSYADGVLVCPTAAGMVVAVDLTTRSLLWGCRYPRRSESTVIPGRMAVMQMNMAGHALHGAYPKWSDSSITIASGRALLTPVDSELIECLNLVDGETLWQRPREEGLYIGCVHDGKILLVERSGFRALNLADGQPAWDGDARPFPGAAVPSGRGFFDGRLYFVPLSSASVAAIDVATGAVVSVSRASETSEGNDSVSIPGNLICYNGSVISQGVDYVECFDQLDELRRRVDEALARTPDDPDALARLGEIDLQEGRLAEAVDHLRRAAGLRDDPRTRQLLFDALFQLLDGDFAANRQLLPEIAEVVDTPKQHSALLRLTATGLEAAGELPAAFDAYLKLLATTDVGGAPTDPMERPSAVWTVRRDRWVQSRLTDLRQAGDDRQRDAIDERLESLLREAIAAETDQPLGRFVDHFGFHPAADEARLALAARAWENDDLLEAELRLRQVVHSTQPRLAATATARLAQIYAKTSPRQAARWMNDLIERWPDVESLDGKTGRQHATELAAAGVAASADVDVWPIGRVEHSTQSGNHASAPRRMHVATVGPTARLDESLVVDVDAQRRTLVAYDGFGDQQWQYSLFDPRQRGQYPFNPSFFHVRSRGHLVVVSMGRRIMALNTMPSTDPTQATEIWSRDLNETIPGLADNRGFNAQVLKVPWAVPRYVPGDAFGREIGVTGPVTSRMVTYLYNRGLVAVDPLSGETLWTRQDLEPGSRVFGDDDRLFVCGPRDEQVTVLRGLDGAVLGQRNVPDADERMTYFGGRVVHWSIRGDQAVLEMDDVWQQEKLWSHSFDADAKVWLVGSEAVGVMQNDGRFRLITLPDGKALVDRQLEPDPQLAEIYVLKSRDRYTLVANRPRINRRAFQVHAVPSGYGNPLINGRVYCFDRKTGADLWGGPIEVEDQALLLRQPGELPVYVFVCQQYEYKDHRRGNGKGKILCIDKRTGRTVYEGMLPAAISNFSVVSSPRNRAVMIHTPVTSIELRFTGEAFPDPPADDARPDEKQAEGTPTGKAVLRGLRTLAETISGSPRAAPADEKLPPEQEGKAPTADDPVQQRF